MVHPCDDKAQFMTAEFSNHAMHLEGTVSSHLDLHIPRAASREVTMVTPIPITSSAAAAVSITTVNTVTSSNESVGLDDPVIETMLDTCESSPSHFPRGISPDDNSCETGSRGNPRSSTQRNYKKRKHGMETFEQVRFHDVVGHGAVKMRIEEMLLPLALPPLLSAKVLTGIRALPASILLYGPPGCGKTQLARAIAGEARAAFYSIAPSDILSKFVGESEEAVRAIFRTAKVHASRLESKCAVVFFDEIDALGQARLDRGNGTSDQDGCSRRILAELLIELNQIADQKPVLQCALAHLSDTATCDNDENETDSQCFIDERIATTSRVILVAATNRIDDCDTALIRRFGVRVFVGPPSLRDRKKMLLHHLHGIDHSLGPCDVQLLATATENWSGSDIQSMTREAAMAPVRECIRSAVVLRNRGMRSGEEKALIESNPDGEARRTMIEGIQKLRPVSLDDFARAMDFFCTGQQHERNPSSGRCDNHYDSSSDEE